MVTIGDGGSRGKNLERPANTKQAFPGGSGTVIQSEAGVSQRHLRGRYIPCFLKNNRTPWSHEKQRDKLDKMEENNQETTFTSTERIIKPRGWFGYFSAGDEANKELR